VSGRLESARGRRAGGLRRRSLVLRTAAGALLVAATLAGTGCAQIIDGFNSLAGAPSPQATAPAAPPAGSGAQMPFDSQFTYDGSVSMSTELASGLELVLDVWAADPRRTQEWYVSADKTFGFAVNVKDHNVDEKAVLTEKRRVYLSSVSITSQTAQSNGQVSSPFTFSADPRTLVPEDTLRNERGLLINTYQGGLLVPEVVIGQMPQDTYGVTLQFALQVYVEGSANTESSFQQRTVYQYLPIAIYPDTDAADQGATDGTGWSGGATSTPAP